MSFEFRKIPKYCISLERSKDRRKAIAAEFRRIGYRIGREVHFFDAIDKEELVIPELSTKYDPILHNDMKKQEIMGALACMYSHVGVMKLALAAGEEMVFICEDDIKLCNDFIARMEYIEGLDAPFDLFCLGGHFPGDKAGHIGHGGVPHAINRIYSVRALNGSYGYIIGQKAMEFFVRNATYNFGVDEFFSNHIYPRFECLCLLPFPIGHKAGLSEITGHVWHYENADWFYEQEAVDLSKPYENHIIWAQTKDSRAHDEAREAWLRRNG